MYIVGVIAGAFTCFASSVFRSKLSKQVPQVGLRSIPYTYTVPSSSPVSHFYILYWPHGVFKGVHGEHCTLLIFRMNLDKCTV